MEYKIIVRQYVRKVVGFIEQKEEIENIVVYEQSMDELDLKKLIKFINEGE